MITERNNWFNVPGPQVGTVDTGGGFTPLPGGGFTPPTGGPTPPPTGGPKPPPRKPNRSEDCTSVTMHNGNTTVFEGKMRNGTCQNTQPRPYSPNNSGGQVPILSGGFPPLLGGGFPPLLGGGMAPPTGGLTPTPLMPQSPSPLNFTGYQEPSSFKSDEVLSDESTSLTDNRGSGLIGYAMGLIGVGVLVYVIGYSFNKGKKEA
tara:strand:- start:1836 stop:2447 length:612 start_codon:yes stop_codon:yes gene_type:complete